MRPLEKRRTSARSEILVDVVHPDGSPKEGCAPCVIGRNIVFDESSMQSYLFGNWEPVIYDALVVAGAIEFCDKSYKRAEQHWGRYFRLSIPVHEPDLWKSPGVRDALVDAVGFVMGDSWSFDFKPSTFAKLYTKEPLLPLSREIVAVMPFSDGLDSLAVAGLMSSTYGDRLLRVHVGSSVPYRRQQARTLEPFTRIPFHVPSTGVRFRESSMRSRGFKFALISAVAAHIAGAERIIVPESGQGAVGPSLVTVGQSYEDYRSSPLFTTRMERFVTNLLGSVISFDFPRLWSTKGETLTEYVSSTATDTPAWSSTRSCWQQSRQVGVQGRRRQCGVCAACMLRRMSIHSAGLSENSSEYVWEDLRATSFELGAAQSFESKLITAAMRQYAIAGTLHLDHLARVRSSMSAKSTIDLLSFQLAMVVHSDRCEIRRSLDRLLRQHEAEWRSYVDSLGADSFITKWTGYSNG